VPILPAGAGADHNPKLQAVAIERPPVPVVYLQKTPHFSQDQPPAKYNKNKALQETLQRLLIFPRVFLYIKAGAGPARNRFCRSCPPVPVP
jgi:hypothetical protein